MRAAADRTRQADAASQQKTSTNVTPEGLPPPPLPIPHSTNTTIPNLPSAPPSGNIHFSNTNNTSTSSTPMMTAVHLPPPPPPAPKRTTNTTATTATSSKTPPRSPNRGPTMVSLPPPPPAAASSSSTPLSSFLADGPSSTTTTQAGDDITVVASNKSPTALRYSQDNDNDDNDNEESSDHNDETPAINSTTPPAPVSEPAARILRLPPTKPDPLPYTAFSNFPIATKTPPPMLAQRQQGQFPILLVATESAHQMAWKNNLLLADMLTGLMRHVATTPSAHTAHPLPPFRSATRTLALDWSENHFESVCFCDSLPTLDDQAAQALLHQAAALEATDGNLEHELHILEDQVDHLLQPVEQARQELLSSNSGSSDLASSGKSPSHSTTTLDNGINWHEQRQRQLDQVTQDAYNLTSPLTIPWLRRYRQALDHVTSNLPHDLTACPVMVLLVCTTQEMTNPMETLRSLESPHYLPEQFHNGLWDPQGLSRHVLVLHDQVEGPKEWDETQLRQSLTQRFGSTATMLRINTIAPETAARLAAEETEDLWQGGGKSGNCLSVSDRVALRKYLGNLVTNALLPSLEKRLAKLNAIVSERKKGVRNVLKSFWRTGKTKEDLEEEARAEGGNSSSAVRYRHDSIESQTRLLADTLFLVGDYDAALSTYRLIRDDYKQDQAHAHYASCQEMMALCMHEMDPYGRAREIFSAFEAALLSFKKAAEEERAADPSLYNRTGNSGQRFTAAPPSTRSASRLCLVMTNSSPICTGRNLEMADLLAAASSNETALGAAVLLEQSSSHYFQDEKYRKYSFHMLMSGHMFRTASQEHHAFRCFTSALHIYRDAQWEELHNHIRSALAAQLYSMGRMSLALQLYAKLVGCRDAPRVSVKSQQKFVNHVLEICNEHFKKALAGADCMIHPMKIRQERLDRITQVIKYTRTASRVLELPNMNLPYIEDDTVLVIAEEGAGGGFTTTGADGEAAFGKRGHGDADVWNRLMLESIAELRTVEASKKSDSMNADGSADEIVTKVLTKIEDPFIRKMIGEIDKEKASRNLLERAKRSPTYKPSPPVRALMEPLAVEFSIRNPLGIPIDLTALQIVATMTKKANDSAICTNEDAIAITPLANKNEGRKWTFHSTALEFEVPDFCRLAVDGASGQDETRTKWKSALEVEPYFVVTKDSFTLEAGSSRTIAISVCPLVEGNFEILGVRCRLFDDIWVYHPFKVKGELLQNTRTNRANRVRGESLVLKSRVERAMPCLTADLIQPLTSANVGDAGPLLQGQVSKWNLRLSNVGTAPAKSITVKTNLPWITVWDGGESRGSKSSEEIERQATSNSVGPSGTMLYLPIDGFGLKVDGEIQPGETVDVAVDLRTTGGGKQDFYMLFRYESVDGTDASVQHRWLRKMLEVSLYPSITLNASLIPSFTNESEHLLSVDITNYRSDRPDSLNLLIDRISLASRSYKLEHLHGQIKPDQSGKSEVKLGWQERVTLHYRVVPLAEDSPSCLLSQSILSSHGGPQTTSSEAASSSVLDFLCLERAHKQFEDTWASHQRAVARAVASQDQDDQHPRSISAIRRANTSLSNAVDREGAGDVVAPTSILRLAPPDSSLAYSILVCSWKSDDGSVEGQHHIRGLPIRPLKESNGCPIVITGNHLSEMTNNFAQGPANVPLEVTLRNRLVVETVDFEFSLEDSTDFDFSGPETFKWSLSGGEKLQVALNAILPAAGVYNIQRIRLTVESEDPVSYLFPLQWNVVVREEA